MIRKSISPGPGRGKSSKTAKPYLGSSEEMERQYDEATLNWKPPKPKGRLASKSRTERE
jgi:hypothetical protein